MITMDNSEVRAKALELAVRSLAISQTLESTVEEIAQTRIALAKKFTYYISHGKDLSS